MMPMHDVAINRKTIISEAYLRIRYSKTENGHPIKKALVYTKDEHGINRNEVDPDALRIVERLKGSGQEAYIVGGAVRDLLVSKRPKDFDIVTDAIPARIKRIFRNSRIIGRRFRLVHVFFGPKIFELSTFRSLKDGTTSNTYGTMEEDAQRRDFTFNALYYDPEEEIVVDYVGGFTDIKKKRVIPVIPLSIIFKDDPVRMIRAAKYAASTGFKLPLLLRWKIKSQAALLDPVSPSRLTEEIVKIVRSGNAAPIINLMTKLGLFIFLQPNASNSMKSDPVFCSRFMNSMAEMDKAVRKEPEAPTGTLLAYLLRDFLETVVDWKSNSTESYRKALAECRSFVLPMNPPRVELENAVRILFRESGVPVKKARTFEKGQRNELVPDTTRGVLKTDLIALDGDTPTAPKKRRRRRTRKNVTGLRPESPQNGNAQADD